MVSEGSSKSPSKENREHVIWDTNGVVSVAGGKLTTYRQIAREILAECRQYLPDLELPDERLKVFTPPPAPHEPGGQRPASISHSDWERLQGSYGPALPQVLDAGAQTRIPGTETYWCELIWAAGHADVVHLDDLMLRRSRLGLVLPDGGRHRLDDIQHQCRHALSWNSDTWAAERERYLALWQSHYSLPPGSSSPDGGAPESSPAISQNTREVANESH